MPPTSAPPVPETDTTHVDVLIVGAGVSGIGAAYHVQDKLPGRSYAILEAREDLGGTWDLFRYPGIRSDSDLHTFGFAFRPWTGEKAIADGPSILRYIRDTAAQYGIDRHIRYGLRVVRAEWSSATALWTVDAVRPATGETVRTTARWLFCASGYYRYDQGYTPDIPGLDDFAGPVVHPQLWPEDLDYDGKRVVVIGSGATAVTLVPAMTDRAAHVTMLQRSPTYVLPVPEQDAVANRLQRLLGEKRGYAAARWKNILKQRGIYAFAQRFPQASRKLIRWVNAKQLEGSGVDVDVHFNPKYDPWDQRLCAVPNADLFRVLRSGKASVVTDHIDRVTETGVRLRSGKELPADVLITATGLDVLTFGGIETVVDSREVHLPDTVAYKGCMLSGVPNFVFAIGYTNSSWTLKVDLVAEYLCRLMAHTAAQGDDAAVPEVPDEEMELRPFLDFQAGYVVRALDRLPKQGTQEPWFLAMDYFKDARYLRRGPVADAPMRFFAAGAAAAPASPAAEVRA
ncbi:NAD(P)/FAD-dependent oxidoreductase [Patulibacter sp. SYSU D01012]|uniref:flavin-containing monooxygenase n=1 Tax=Patulibacter sp. SYSU D01012 TaxID=2817381 RepID=UPI001B312A9F|nr:NAD(P)/FAD-dependent oxidoreductase [Patulibacter sp. SYSU D01012]